MRLAPAAVSVLVLALLGAGPSPFQPYQFLAQGARWNYVCNDGITATRAITLGSIGTQAGYADTFAFNVPGQPSVQFGELELNDSQGTRTAGFLFAPTFPSIAISPPQIEFAINPVIGQSVSFPDGAGGVVTVTYQGFANVSVPAGIYNAGVFTESSNSAQPPIPFPRTLYMVRGMGVVEFQQAAWPAQNLPAATCGLFSFNL